MVFLKIYKLEEVNKPIFKNEKKDTKISSTAKLREI